MKLLALLVLAGALLVAPASAGKPNPFDLPTLNPKAIETVYQQSPLHCHPPIPEGTDLSDCVVNPLRPECMWNIDDQWGTAGSGTIEPYAVHEASVCMVGDMTYRVMVFAGRAPSPDLIVSVTYEPQGVTFQLTSELLEQEPKKGKPQAPTWRYYGCVIGPIYGNVMFTGPEIEGSNGGHGYVTRATVRVENPTGARVKDAFMGVSAGRPVPPRTDDCKGDISPLFSLGGATWRTAI